MTFDLCVQVLRQEQGRIQQVLSSRPQREAAVPGGVAMAAAFASYLGPYHYNFRRLLLTVHWPNCLRERGVPLVIDSIDSARGQHCLENIWMLQGQNYCAGLGPVMMVGSSNDGWVQ